MAAAPELQQNLQGIQLQQVWAGRGGWSQASSGLVVRARPAENRPEFCRGESRRSVVTAEAEADQSVASLGLAGHVSACCHGPVPPSWFWVKELHGRDYFKSSQPTRAEGNTAHLDTEGL